MKNIPKDILLFGLFVILLAAYCWHGDDTVRDMMLGAFAAALAVMRSPNTDSSSAALLTSTSPGQPAANGQPATPTTTAVLGKLAPMLLFAAIGFASLALNGCTTGTLTPSAQTALATGEKIFAAVEPLVEDYAADGQVNYAQAIPVALNSLAIFDPAAAVDAAQLSAQIQTAVTAFTNGNAKTTGQKIAAVVLAQLPANPTGAQANAALTQAGLGANTGAATIAATSTSP